MTFDSSDSHRNTNPLKYLQEIISREPLPLELGETLPEITVGGIVEAPCRLIDHFGIGRLRALPR